MTKLDSFEALEDARRRSHAEPVVLYKHSNTCGVSTMARREITSFHDAERVPVYEVVVQTARHISDEIEQRYGIRHESPQVIVLHRDRPVYDTSHGRIRREELRDVINSLQNAGVE